MGDEGHFGLKNEKVAEAVSGDFFGALSALKVSQNRTFFVIHVYSNAFSTGPYLQESNTRSVSSGRPSKRENFLERLGFEFSDSCNVLPEGRCYYQRLEEITGEGSLSFDTKEAMRVTFVHDAFKKFISNLQAIFEAMLHVDTMLFEAGIELPWTDLKLAPIVSDAKERVYEKGQVYDFYKDIRDITQLAKAEVFLIDAYPDEEVLDLYLEKVPVSVKIRILTNNPKGKFVAVAHKFKMKPGVAFEVRRNNDCHDRIFFIDGECWVMGQSLKDAAKKPTYLVKIESNALFKKVFDDLWSQSAKLV
jgi:hypothetical protein